MGKTYPHPANGFFKVELLIQVREETNREEPNAHEELFSLASLACFAVQSLVCPDFKEALSDGQGLLKVQRESTNFR